DEPETTAISLSARSGEGIELLRQELLNIAGWHQAEDVFIARERHLRALATAQEHIAAARNVVEGRMPALELFAEELRLAQQSLGEITGEFTADDLLGVIFSRFCIGK
ncbi:MAG TPA: tRNA uridine-5-carboxymethylaminomethyl(34) synthesis GTPase MnmE, partial [Azonexus sp.]|nr:tRNA uridine-5-carboxymethylaminomethyl(34) synthesis GTPase MnmE [Azonexus sp.]